MGVVVSIVTAVAGFAFGIFTAVLVRLLVLAVVMVVFALVVSKVAAQSTEPQPTLRIFEVRVFHDVVEDGDALVLVSYQIRAGTDAMADVDTYTIRITPEAGAEDFTRGVEAVGLEGYGRGLAGFYATAGELDGDYEAEVRGSEAISWTGGTTPSVTLAFSTMQVEAVLSEYVLDTIAAIDAGFVVLSIDGGRLLSSTGAAYAEAALPAPSRYIGSLFLVRSMRPEALDLSPLPTPAVTYTDRAEDRIAGTMIEEAAEAVADDFGITTGLAIGMGLLAVVMAIFMLVVKDAGPAGIPFAFMLCAIALVAATFAGLPEIVLSLFAMGAVFIIGWQFFFKRAA